MKSDMWPKQNIHNAFKLAFYKRPFSSTLALLLQEELNNTASLPACLNIPTTVSVVYFHSYHGDVLPSSGYWEIQ